MFIHMYICMYVCKIFSKNQNAKYSISLQKDNVWNKLKQCTIFR